MLTPKTTEEKIREEWREEIKRFPQMDALGSADWWLAKMSSIRADEKKKNEETTNTLLAVNHTNHMKELERVRADERARVREVIEGMKRTNILVETPHGQVNCHDCKRLPVSPFCRHSQGRNDALSDLLSKLLEE